jgi:hypothetical protein
MKIGRVSAFALVSACAIGGSVAIAQVEKDPFTLPQEVVSAATAFQSYMQSASRIDSGFSSGDAVARGLKSAASYEPAQMEEGMIAYGAIAALQDDRFVRGVQQAAGRGDQEAAFAERLIEDPTAATQVDGADEAAARVEAALSAQAEPLVSDATDVKSAAYSVQHQAWSKVTVADASGRLAEVKSLSKERAEPSDSDNQAMMVKVAETPLAPFGSDDAPRYTAVEARSLALAAESILGHARGADRDRLSPLLTETSGAFCLKMAKLNLYQCMAVAGPQYEDIFCMGQHAMYDTGQCVDQAAHHGGASTTIASLSPRPTGERALYTPLAAHRSLRIDPN